MTELRKNLIVVYITFTSAAFLLGLLGQLTHKLSAWNVVELCAFVIAFSALWTWWQVRDAHQMSHRLRIVREHLEAFDLEVVALKNEQFSIADHHIVPDVREPHGIYVAEQLDINELEAFSDGVATGWRVSTYNDEQEDEDNPLTIVGTMIPSDVPPETLGIGLQLVDEGNEWIYSGG